MRNLLMVVLLLSSASARAVTLDDIAFMAGHWVGGDGDYEEVWLAPSKGTLPGTFRWHFPNGRTVLEYLVIAEIDGAIELRFKHFETNYETWEDTPNTYTLESVGEEDGVDVVRFMRTSDPYGAVPKVLEYRREGNTLRFIGHADDPSDKPIKLEFTLRE